MAAILRLDETGVVLAANDTALQLLGPCVGRRCCDVVAARASDRSLICGTACAARLDCHQPAVGRRGVLVRDQVVWMICGAPDTQKVVVLVDSGAEQAVPTQLSPRERGILALVAAGEGDSEIASLLGIQPSTVKTHLVRARTKLGATTRAQAVALAMRAGLIS